MTFLRGRSQPVQEAGAPAWLRPVLSVLPAQYIQGRLETRMCGLTESVVAAVVPPLAGCAADGPEIPWTDDTAATPRLPDATARTIMPRAFRVRAGAAACLPRAMPTSPAARTGACCNDLWLCIWDDPLIGDLDSRVCRALRRKKLHY